MASNSAAMSCTDDASFDSNVGMKKYVLLEYVQGVAENENWIVTLRTQEYFKENDWPLDTPYPTKTNDRIKRCCILCSTKTECVHSSAFYTRDDDSD